MSGRTVCDYFPTEVYTSKQLKGPLNLLQMNQLGMLQKKIELISKPLCSIALHGFQFVNNGGLF